MSLWSNTVRLKLEEQRPSASEYRWFALQCAKHAVSISRPKLVGIVPIQSVEMLHDVVSYIENQLANDRLGTSNLELAKTLESLIPEEDSALELESSWYSTLFSVLHALRTLEAADPSSLALESAYSAYQAITGGVIASAIKAIGRGIDEQELTAIEKSSPLCQEEIVFQMALLED